MLHQYLADADAKSQPRTRMNLPWGAMPDVLPADDAPLQVKWASARRPQIERNGAEVHVVANGRRWHFAAAASPMLERLSSGEVCSVAEFGEVDAATARAFVRELIVNGLVVVV